MQPWDGQHLGRPPGWQGGWHRPGTLAHFGFTYGGQVVLLAVVGVICLAVAFMARRSGPWRFGLVPAPSIMAMGSALGIAVVTLTPLTNAFSPGRLQLHPLATIRTYVSGGAGNLTIYLFGNIALFVPLGFFLYLALRRGLLVPIVLTVMTSVSVEVLQLGIWSRSTDVDDVLTNSIGGLIGVLAGAVVLAFLPQRPPPVLTTDPREPATASGSARRSA